MTVKEREELEKLVRTGKRAVAALLHAWILLKADMGAAEGGWWANCPSLRYQSIDDQRVRKTRVMLVTLPEALRFLGLPSAVVANLRQVIYGILLVLMMMVRPQGLAGRYGFGRWMRRLKHTE
jgi:hypothetical protein